LTVGSGLGAATFDLEGSNQTVSSLSDGGVTTGVITNLNSGTTHTLTVAGSANNTFGGTIQGNLNLAVATTGTLTLSGASSYTGSTTLSGGTLKSGATNALSTTTHLTVSGGTFNLEGNSQTVGGLSDGGSGAGTITSSTGTPTFTVNGGGTYSGTLSGSLGLTEAGTGTLTLSGTDSYTGATTVGSTATLLLGGALSTSGVVDNGKVGFTTPVSDTFSSLTGSGILSLTNTSSAAAVALTLGNSSATTFSGQITGFGSLTKVGAGTTTLNGVSNYTGTTTISAGVLNIATGGSDIDGGALSIATNAELLVSGGTFTTSANPTLGITTSLTSPWISVTGGTANFNGGLTLPGNGNGFPWSILVSGGTLNASNITLVRLNSSSFLDTVNTSIGLIINGGAVNVTNALSTGDTNSAVNVEISAGSLTVGGTTTIGGQTTTATRFSDIAVAGGTFTDNDTSGVGIQIGGDTSQDSYDELYVAGGTVITTAITFGDSSESVGTNYLHVSSGALYVGANGMNDGGSSGPDVITLSGGILGAQANWTSSLAMVLAGTSASNFTIQTADVTGTVGNSITLTGSLSGTFLNEAGLGILTLSGVNTYTGGTTISSGTVDFANTGAMPAAGAVAVSSGATLAIGVGDVSGGLFTNATSGNGSIGGLLAGLGGQSGSTVTWSAGSILGIDTTNADSGSFTYAGNIANTGAGALGLTKLGAGMLTLTGTNSFTGATTVLDGTLAYGSTSSFGGGSTIDIADGTTLLYTGVSGTVTQTIVVTSGTGTISNTGGGVVTLSGGINKNGTVADLSGGEFVVSGAITGSSPDSDLDVSGGSTVGLTTANSYNGPTVISGSSTLLTGVDNALPSPAPYTDLTVTGSGDTLDILGHSETVDSLSGSGQIISGNGSASTPTLSTAASSGTGSLTVNTTNYSGTDTFGGSLGGSNGYNNFSLTKAGTGTLALTSSNTYAGGTTVSGGTLSTLVSGATGTGAVSVGSSGTWIASGTVTTSGVSSGTAVSIAGTLDLSSASGGTGTSTLTLALQTGTSVNLVSAAKFTFDLGANGISDQVDITGGTLALNTQNFGDFTFTELGSFTGTGTYDLFVTGGSGDITGSLGTTTGSVTGTVGTYAATLSLNADAAGTLAGTQYLVLTVGSVPEPSSWALMIGGFALLLVLQARRRRS
jgi:autotransporter-associated beta strand protein